MSFWASKLAKPLPRISGPQPMAPSSRFHPYTQSPDPQQFTHPNWDRRGDLEEGEIRVGQKRGIRSAQAVMARAGKGVAKHLKTGVVPKFAEVVPPSVSQLFPNGRVTYKKVNESLQGINIDTSKMPVVGLDPGPFYLFEEVLSDGDSTSAFNPSASVLPATSQSASLGPGKAQPSRPILLARLQATVNPKAAAELVRLQEAMQHRGVAGERCRRDAAPAIHAPVWQKTKQVPYIIAKVRDLSSEDKVALNEFCGIIRDHVGEPVMAFFKEAMPDYAFALKRIHRYKCMALVDNDPLLPDIDLGPAFVTAAFKKGGCLNNHGDPDHKRTWAVVITGGDYTGGEFCLPHMQKRVHLPPGSILIVKASTLVHSTSLFLGDRYVVTGFIDWNLASAAGIDTAEFWSLSDEEYDEWVGKRLEPKVASYKKDEERRLRNQAKNSDRLSNC
ncbi:hypothetical protein M407DRAFT_23045 [Tulasnella calospora MUT 4182]|uniref:Uncharacterized protein n=1 Tax=Tulasnella calospora MUT 4182 TaxID=1051891 RepID=A0A0C3L1W1_9AGAM|nr:hypothetical protein M407DRAFT_23045 [Tulasnella calospora MUT 4182]